jgi:uncharacterized phiE125 gp8 family phage protein
MGYGLRRLTGPASPPVSLSDAKAHLYLTEDDPTHDGDMSQKLAEAIAECERKSGRSFGVSSYRLTLDAFPVGGEPIVLPVPPCVSVTELTYRDEAGSQIVLPPTGYWTDLDSEPARIVPVSVIWPATQLRRPAAVTVTFTAGYGPGQLPADLLSAVKLLLAQRWYGRGDGDHQSHTLGSLELVDRICRDYSGHLT